MSDMFFVLASQFTDTQAPSVPTGLIINLISANAFTVSWNATTDNVGVAGYQLHWSTNGTTWTEGATTTLLTQQITGLSSSTYYYIQVRAFDDAGNYSGWGISVLGLTSAGADVTAPTPGTLTWTGLGTAGYFNYTGVPLTWTLGSDNTGITKMEVQMKVNAGSWSTVQTYTGAPPTNTSYTHSTARTTNTAYYYRIKYSDAALNFAYSNEKSAIHDSVAPSVPTGLNFTVGGLQ